MQKNPEFQIENALEEMVNERSYRILESTNFDYPQVILTIIIFLFF